MLKNWWRLTRAEHGLIVFLAILVSQFVVTKALTAAMIWPAVGPMLITWGAFAWNDYFGYKSDKALNRKDRPLVAGTITPRVALWVGSALMILGVALTYPVGVAAFGIAIVYTALSMAYDLFLKTRPLLGNLFIASSMSISFIYGNYAASDTLHPYVLLYAGVAFFAGLGRELIITLRDVEGDKKAGATTLPMLLGPRVTVTAASALIYGAAALSLVPLLRPVSIPYIALAVLTDALFLVSTYYVLLSQKLQNLNMHGRVGVRGARDLEKK
ncbi:geranylgeranylglycerol-phosphate geranylgeranyltransferase [Candidatus Micrarchaeota archaeon]|nr:geranylgeranylglycerol-phosphate geranylgeranyltransferase [Candidatus Micrarchaeota archaeon]